ncbi:hypothetical protein ACFL1R_10030 [Candidatus Latescibacterota bacterium]
MKNIIKICILLFLGLVVCQVFGYADFYNRAPDTLPGLLPEMNQPSYWIAKMKNPDEVILTHSAIRKMNEAYMRRMSSPDPFKGVDPERMPKEKDLNRWPGRFIIMPDIEGMTPSQLAETVREEIKNDIAFMRGEYLQDIEGLNVKTQKFGNMLGIEYTGWELDDMENEMALDRVGNDISIRDGITVRDALLRIVPTLRSERVGLMENGKTRWDVWNVNIVRIGSYVRVLHPSRTGGYLFVLSDEGYGWIRSEDIAFGSKATIERYSNTSNFVVCTGDFVPFYSDESCTYVSGRFRMGDRLPLASPDNTRMINVPVREINSRFKVEKAYLARDAYVSVGYLPYTRRNIVETAFKLLGNPYDWSMAWYGRNHETTDRDIFACFGFNLPFNAELFTFFGNNPRVVRPGEGREAQYKAILANEPFVTIQTCGGGHNQLFLGEYNGEPIVLDTHGYGYNDRDGTRYEIRRLVVGDMSQPEYFLKTSFTFLELK